MTEIEFQNGSKITALKSSGKTIRGKVRGYVWTEEKKTKFRGGCFMKKILKGLWRNYYFILGTIIMITAIFKGNTYEGIILCVLGVSCLVLQKLNEVKSKLEDMEIEYLENELTNIKNQLSLAKMITYQK